MPSDAKPYLGKSLSPARRLPVRLVDRGHDRGCETLGEQPSTTRVADHGENGRDLLFGASRLGRLVRRV